MSGSTISGIVTIGVTIGSATGNGTYASPLTITSTGTIAPASGSNALYSNYKGSYDPQTYRFTGGIVSNSGTILGVSNTGQFSYGGAAADFIGGTLTNTGSIAGGSGFFGGDGVELKQATLTNSGIVAAGGGANGSGVFLYGGAVMNSGSIIGSGAGVNDFGGNITNNGVISGGGGTGVDFAGFGTLLNNGTVSGGYGGKYGVEQLFDGRVFNAGTISGGSGGSAKYGAAGDLLNGGGEANDVTLNNEAGGTIVGGFGTQTGGSGVVAAQLGSIGNFGLVLGGAGGTTGGDGAEATNNGIIVNYGTILGGSGTVTGGDGAYVEGSAFSNFGTVIGGGGPTAGVGIALNGNGVLVTSGLIAGGNNGAADAIDAYGGTLQLVVDPGASFRGAVVAEATAANGLELASGSSAGALDMGGSFSGFTGISFDSGATWALSGMAGQLAGGETITGFAPQDTLFLESFVASSDSYVAGSGLIISNGTTLETLDITGSFSTSSFLVTATGGETEVELLCYLRGTRIATPAGDVPVERLAIGDAVVTRFGGYRKIKWIGRQGYGSRFIRRNRNQIPVRIAAGALAANLPQRDLFVSPGHSMLLGDVLVLARDLLNGVTVTQDDLPDEVHYFQLELDSHDCVLAEGVWSESFCDYGGLRNQFHNAAEFWQLYPHHVTPAAHRMCAPRPEAGEALAAALLPVTARAAASVAPGTLQGWVDEVSRRGLVRGWAQDTANPELPVLLEIMAGDRWLGRVLACDPREDLATAGIGRGRCAFAFDAGKIPRRTLAALYVRRAGDAAALPMAPHCLADAGTTPRLKRAS